MFLSFKLSDMIIITMVATISMPIIGPDSQELKENWRKDIEKAREAWWEQKEFAKTKSANTGQ